LGLVPYLLNHSSRTPMSSLNRKSYNRTGAFTDFSGTVNTVILCAVCSAASPSDIDGVCECVTTDIPRTPSPVSPLRKFLRKYMSPFTKTDIFLQYLALPPAALASVSFIPALLASTSPLISLPFPFQTLIMVGHFLSFLYSDPSLIYPPSRRRALPSLPYLPLRPSVPSALHLTVPLSS